ncbi:MAG TPA: fatty acid--CoA ligase family protein [Acidimicrobiia bacterium]|nr:fatty acid--CoA ligase family protein [Acidimicrobiia bacterium]
MPPHDEAEAVAVLLPAPEAARAAVGLWEAGEAVMPLDPAAPGPDLRRSLAALRPTAVIDRDGRHPAPGGIPVAAGVAAVLATSGTTAERKGVELTFAGLAASAAALASLPGNPEGGWLCCLPLHHVAGLAVVGRAWVNGLPVTVHAGFDAAAVGDAAGEGAAFVSLVPTMMQRLLDHDPAAAARFEHVLLGGGPIGAGLLQRARAAGATVSTTYGMTETWGGVVHNGHPLPGVELRLDGAAGPDGVGEILVRGPMLMRGYRLWPEGTAAAVDADGWYRTGDLGRFDPAAGGRLWVVDRIGDVVNSGGVKVSPTEVERVLAAHPSVVDVCVAGRPDPEWGQRIVAFVVPAVPGDPPPLDDLRAFARRHLPAAKLPRQVVILPAIPRTAGGKPLRRLLPGE